MPLFRKAGQKWKRDAGVARANKVARNSMAIQKVDAKLRAYRREDTEYTGYQVTQQSLGLGFINVMHLTQMAAWTKRFGPDPGGTCSLVKIEMDLHFKCANEPSPVTFSCFLATLNPQNADQITENLGQTLAGLIQNIHFIDGVATGPVNQGQVYLNPEFFRVHKTWKFTIGTTQLNSTSEAQRSGEFSHKRIVTKLYHQRKLANGRGNFDPSSQSTITNESKVYLIVFTDNLVIDLQYPTLDVNALCTVKST